MSLRPLFYTLNTLVSPEVITLLLPTVLFYHGQPTLTMPSQVLQFVPTSILHPQSA